MKKTFCNICGKEFDEYDENNAFYIWSHPQYGSKFDGELVTVDMCVDCFDKLVESCAVNPIADEARRARMEEMGVDF